MRDGQGVEQQAVIYARVSSRKQVAEGSGLESQEVTCREYAARKGYHVRAVYTDDLTGKSEQRGGLQAMISTLRKSRGETVVIIDDLNRLARSVRTHFAIRDAIAAAGARLESPKREFAEDPEDDILEVIEAAFASEHRRKNAEQTKTRMRARLLNGYWPFQPPRGYKFEKRAGEGNVIVREEPVASILAEALQGMASGRFETKTEMKRFLEAQADYPKDKPDGTIRHQRIDDILSRVIYAGYVEHTPWDVSLRKGKHDPLISLEDFQRIQDRLQSRPKAPMRADTSAEYPLRGWVLCDDCGNPMTSSTSKGRSKYYAYYMCATPGCVSKGKSIPRDKVHSDLEKLLGELRPSRPLFDICFAMFCDAWEHSRKRTQQQLAHLKEQARKAEHQIASLLDRIVDADNPRVIAAYEKRIAEMEREKALAAEKQATMSQPTAAFAERFRTAMLFLANPQKHWGSGRLDLQRLVLKLVFLRPVAYHRNEGFRTAQTSVPFTLLGQNGPEGKMARPAGLEPAASRLEVSRSIQMS